MAARDLFRYRRKNQRFKSENEKLWARMNAYYKNSTWLPGLTERQIAYFEKEMGFNFPEIYRMYLKCMNGTNEYTYTHDTGLRAYTEYGSSGSQENYEVVSHLFHSYPRDFREMKEEIDGACRTFGVTPQKLDDGKTPHIMPIKKHVFLVMDCCELNPVLAIYYDEAPKGLANIEADSLNNYLYFDLVQREPQLLSNDAMFKINSSVRFWLGKVDLKKDWPFYVEIRLVSNIGENDFNSKIRTIKILLMQGKRVRVRVFLRGLFKRPESGIKLLQRIIEAVKDQATIEKQPVEDRQQSYMLLAPKSPMADDHKTF
jgi:hypothetical protein